MKIVNNIFSKNLAYWGTGALIALFLAKNIASQPLETLIAVVSLGLIFSTGLYGIILLPIIGELIRMPFGPEGGVLISDVVIPIFLLIWLVKNFKIPKSKLLTPLLVFFAIAFLSLIQALLFLEAIEVAISSLYLIRFAVYTLTFLAVIEFAKPKKLFSVLVFSALMIALAGFIQLKIYPDLAALEELGWDPHINRLVSTWLDPNFVGGLFAFMTSLILGVTLHIKGLSKKLGLSIIMLFLIVALFLTYSRSAYLALAAGIFIISALKSRKIIVIAIIALLLAIGASDRAQERVGELAISINSLVFNTADTPDPTAKLRIDSWRQTTEIIKERPLLGTGYNTLRYVNHQKGYAPSTQNHSAGGSDSSLLTILATTGIFGLAAFLWLYFTVIQKAFQNWRNKKLSPFNKGLGLGMIGGLAALFIHSIFVNSLLFPQILIFLWISIGLIFGITQDIRPSRISS